MVGLKIAPGYLRLLELESTRLGMGRRQFLLMLHLRRTGDADATRVESAPKYELSAKELSAEPKFYKWALTAEQRKSVDRERRKIGSPTTSWYVVLLLCNWFGIDPMQQGMEPEDT
jgi:hypothetical protein